MTLSLGTRREVAPDRAFRSVELRRLDWDTTFFGRKMGVLELNSVGIRGPEDRRLALDLRVALQEAAADGYEHVILRISSDQPIAIRAAEHAGLGLVDTALDLVLRLSRKHATESRGTAIRRAVEEDMPELQEIAGSAFALSRFAADPFFAADEVAALYRQWIANLCHGPGEVLVAEAGDELAGFIACASESESVGRIPLIATGEPHRRQGVARALLEASIGSFARLGARKVFVKTQAANYPALALYQRFGFEVARSELTFSAGLRTWEAHPR